MARTSSTPSRYATVRWRGRPGPGSLRALGALSLLATGAVQLQQFAHLYHAIPTIGALFVVNFAGASAIGLVLLAPVERLLGRRGETLLVLAAAAGIALAVTSFTFLLISEHSDHGDRRRADDRRLRRRRLGRRLRVAQRR